MSKNEIKRITEQYALTLDLSYTEDEDMKFLIQNVRRYIQHEKPDAYIEKKGTIFGIEHFQVSLYRSNQKGDISKIAERLLINRKKVKHDVDYDFCPSIENLLIALGKLLDSHSKSFDSYQTNLTSLFGNKNKEYKLVIFVEDSSESGYIVRNNETRIVNLLQIKQISEILIKYKSSIWGILLSTGNEIQKSITGCTLSELSSKLNSGRLIDAKQCRPFETERKVHRSKDASSQDSNNVKIYLSDRI